MTVSWINRFHRDYSLPSIVVTENGAAFADTATPDGRVHDPARTQYLRDHLRELLRAQKEGVPVDGYFVWTLTDNFEWAEGCRPRFGIIHVDFPTQQRTVKDSGRWYGSLLRDQD